MEKEYIVDFEAIGCTDDTLQGVFNEKTVIKEVKDFLEARYGDRLKWFVISEDRINGLEEIYNSRNKVIMKLDTLDECLDEYNKLIEQGRNVFWGRVPEGWFEITEE